MTHAPNLTLDHVRHVNGKNEKLHGIIERMKKKGAKFTERGVRTVEVIAGSTLGGLVQGLAKDPNTGARLFHIPVDLLIGGALNVAGYLDLAGDEWSPHLNNVGDGFVGAYFSDLGHSIGARKVATGSFFSKGAKALGQGAAAGVSGQISPQQMAENLLREEQQRGG